MVRQTVKCSPSPASWHRCQVCRRISGRGWPGWSSPIPDDDQALCSFAIVGLYSHLVGGVVLEVDYFD